MHHFKPTVDDVHLVHQGHNMTFHVITALHFFVSLLIHSLLHFLSRISLRPPPLHYSHSHHHPPLISAVLCVYKHLAFRKIIVYTDEDPGLGRNVCIF